MTLHKALSCLLYAVASLTSITDASIFSHAGMAARLALIGIGVRMLLAENIVYVDTVANESRGDFSRGLYSILGNIPLLSRSQLEGGGYTKRREKRGKI